MDNNDNNKNKVTSMFSFKNIFFLIILLSFAPAFLKTVQKYIKRAVSPDTYVGCINVTGLMTDSSFYVKNIHKFLNDKKVKALLLKIKTPGGLPGTAQTLFNEINKFREKKPVVALIEDLGASGGYYVAAAADTIIANKSALVGSIGVRMMTGNIKALLNSFKIEVKEISSGKFKTTTSFIKEKNPEEIAYLQELSDDVYDQFIKDMAQRRNLSLDKGSVWADGKIFTGNQALELNLIDKHGSISETKEELLRLIVDRGETVEGKIRFKYPRRLTGFAKLFYGDMDEDGLDTSASFVANFVTSIYDKIMTTNDDRQIQLR